MLKVDTRLPDWLETRHEILREAFGDSTFTVEDAARVLKEKKGNEIKEIPIFLSELRKAGYVEVKPDPSDARKKWYKLKGKEKILAEAFEAERKKIGRGEIEGLLKSAADLIRTRVDYKFILVLLFLKRISDKWELEFESAYRGALEDGLSKEMAEQEARSSAYHDFDLPEEYLWNNIRKDVSRLPENFSRAMKTISERNPELKDVLESADFVHFTTSRENTEILRQLVELFSERELTRVSPDILGDAYEWILRYFAPQKAKEGEVYTPREVIKLLVNILDPKPNESVYDPASASNGMLILSYKHVEKHEGKSEADKLFLHGQEVNPGILALGRMNLYIHDIKNANVVQGDTLLYPKFKEREGLKKLNVVMANPPWNQDGYYEEVLKKGEFWKQRFCHGFTPRQSADWAWIQHMVASADDAYGRVGVVIDNGCLFRGGKEKGIRSGILNDDLIDCVILLPEKLFYNTGAPGAIIILNKNKPKERENKVLFINATNEYEPHPEVRRLNRLGDKHIKKIAGACKITEDIDGFSKLVPLKKIEENDYNLNVTLYVFPKEEAEKIDLSKEWEELHGIEEKLTKVNKKIEEHLIELKLEK